MNAFSVLIDDNEVDADGNKIMLSLICHQSEDNAIVSYELVRDKISAAGVERIGTFYLSPDQIPVLLRHLGANCS